MNSRHSGFSYLEVLIATLIIAITLVPALDALTPAMQGSALHQRQGEVYFALSGKLEEVLAQPFADLDAAATAAGSHQTPTSYSDVFNPEIQRDVFIWRYDVDDADSDGDVFTGGEADLLWVQVSLPNGDSAFETLISQY